MPPLHPHFLQGRDGSSWPRRLPESGAGPPPSPLPYGQVGKLSQGKCEKRAPTFPGCGWERHLGWGIYATWLLRWWLSPVGVSSGHGVSPQATPPT